TPRRASRTGKRRDAGGRRAAPARDRRRRRRCRREGCPARVEQRRLGLASGPASRLLRPRAVGPVRAPTGRYLGGCGQRRPKRRGPRVARRPHLGPGTDRNGRRARLSPRRCVGGGHETGFNPETPQCHGGRCNVARVETRGVNGAGLDLRTTWAARLPWRPALTLGYAFGTGDGGSGRGTDGAFRQTGL